MLLAHARQVPSGIRPRRAHPFAEGYTGDRVEEVGEEHRGVALQTRDAAQPARHPQVATLEKDEPPPDASGPRGGGGLSPSEMPDRHSEQQQKLAAPYRWPVLTPRAEPVLPEASRREEQPETPVVPSTHTRGTDSPDMPMQWDAHRTTERSSPAPEPLPPAETPQQEAQVEMPGFTPPRAAPVPLPALSPAPAARQRARGHGDLRETPASAVPTVEIHIGRIEVRAVPPARPERPSRTAPSLSLDDYLKQQRP